MVSREPYKPGDDWTETYTMLCGYCRHQTQCQIVEAMIAYANGDGPWPQGGWVTDPGAGVTCLSYEPRPRKALSRQRLRAITRTKDASLPPVCEGCASRKGSEASTALHTQRDYAAAVRDQAPFVCHEDPNLQRLCGGWCRAIKRKRKAE